MTGEPKPPSVMRVAWLLMRNEPVSYAIAWLQWLGFHSLPLAIGLAARAVVDRLVDGPAGVPVLLLAGLLGLEVARWALFLSAAYQYHGAFIGWTTVPRVNALTSLATGGGPAAGRLPSSPGEAVSRFRDDSQDVSQVVDAWLDTSTTAVVAVVGLVIMVSITPVAAVAAAVPVGVATIVSLRLAPRLRAWRRAAREMTGQVTGFLGDTFGSILAVKTTGSEAAVDRRFAELNARRAGLSRRDQLGGELVRSLGYGTAEVTVGAVLLLVAGSFQRGELRVGDVVLFASYVQTIASLPKWVGRLGAYLSQADVSVDRLAELTRERTRPAAFRPVKLHLRHGPPPLEHSQPEVGGFESLVVRGLSVLHRGSGRGVLDVDIELRAGELVVVTGPVGAGKSTLLRGVLGAVQRSAGTVRWNGELVDDPATVLVPPRVAYLPQVPRLFSEPLAQTILLGHDDEELDRAIWLACLDEDVAGMPAGIDTLIGPRGLRLSGGQIQRAGAARALVRRPQVLVVDDLSSALDVETELRLWERVRAHDPSAATLLVSHRPHVLDRADRVYVLDDGRLVSSSYQA